jgi:hypothetical protein
MLAVTLWSVQFLAAVAAEEQNLVANGSFEASQRKAGVPDEWSTSGNSSIRQQLVSDTGRDGGMCAKLECSHFVPGGADFHVMICQVGKVSVEQGRWYRLSLWAKARDLEEGSVEVALSNMNGWQNGGLSDAFLPRGEWERFEFVFRAKSDVPAESSRLQFWFKSTGTLWLDDVTLVETREGQRWLPEISAEGVKNLVPNSSFECGSANWGSFTWGLSGWAGNLYRLEGTQVDATAEHGKNSLLISLDETSLPVYWFDYYEPVKQPVRRVLAANRGWFSVRPGEKYTLSAFLKSDAPGAAAELAVNEAPSRLQHKQVRVGTDWQRYEFSFSPSQSYAFVAVGLDLEASQRSAAKLWIDAVQFERGDRATTYEPRVDVESFVESDAAGNIFTNVAAGAVFRIRGFNNGAVARSVQGQLKLTDFFDAPVFKKDVELQLPAGCGGEAIVGGARAGQAGYYRADWQVGDANHSLRCSIIEPAAPDLADSLFGFNHAYPWDFLVSLSRDAGVAWWRDWSAKWQTVEPQRGRFDFSVPDEQIRRVLRLDGNVEVLLPFPSAAWSTSASEDQVRKAAGNDSYLKARLPMAFAPKDPADFGRYAAEVARHYRQERGRGITHFQFLNEPVYTDYALPRKFGYGLADYLKLLEIGSRAVKSVDPQCVVVGGISANLRSDMTRDFVTHGGLQWVDVVDLHLYDPPRPVGTFEEPYRQFAELLEKHGGPKPIWISEWGCYADDDPPCIPQTVGDDTMNRCRWPSERAATEHIVKFTALSFANGVRKIFFHAGTCGPINGPDAGGVLYEYGGTPRKMYAGVSAMTKLLGVPRKSLQTLNRGGLRVCIFQTGDHATAVVWQDGGTSRMLRLSGGVVPFDIMGNRMSASSVSCGESPIYLVAPEASQITASL